MFFSSNKLKAKEMLQKRNNFHAELRKKANVFHTPPLPFYASQIINPFHNSRTSSNNDGWTFSQW